MMSVKWWFNTLEPTHNPYASQILSKTHVIYDVPLQVNAIELLFNTDQSLLPPVCPLLVVGHASTVAQLPRRQGPRSPSRVFDRLLLLLPDFPHKRYLNPASRMPASVASCCSRSCETHLQSLETFRRIPYSSGISMESLSTSAQARD